MFKTREWGLVSAALQPHKLQANKEKVYVLLVANKRMLYCKDALVKYEFYSRLKLVIDSCPRPTGR